MTFSFWAMSGKLSGCPLSHMNGGDTLNKNNVPRCSRVKRTQFKWLFRRKVDGSFSFHITYRQRANKVRAKRN